MSRRLQIATAVEFPKKHYLKLEWKFRTVKATFSQGKPFHAFIPVVFKDMTTMAKCKHVWQHFAISEYTVCKHLWRHTVHTHSICTVVSYDALHLWFTMVVLIAWSLGQCLQFLVSTLDLARSEKKVAINSICCNKLSRWTWYLIKLESQYSKAL